MAFVVVVFLSFGCYMQTTVDNTSSLNTNGAQGYPQAIDSRGHTMVNIPEGTFTMGITIDDAEYLCAHTRNPEQCDPIASFETAMPAHKVIITTDFWIDVYEVTNGQYAECVNAGVCQPPDYPGSFTRDSYYGDPTYLDFPVDNITYENAVEFCQTWRGGRLPTEAEWEYAARGTDERLWPWGNSVPDSSYANFLPVDESTMSNDTVQVGSYPSGASPFGVMDMAGNLFEWTSTRLYTYQDTQLSDPTIPIDGTRGIVRGGAYLSSPSGINVSSRYEASITTSGLGGIRCVIDDLENVSGH